MHIRPRGLLGTWVKYNQNYFCLYLFWQLTYRLDPLTDFHAWWLKRRGLAQGCAILGIFLHRSPYRGSKKPKKQFWSVNKRFQAKLAKSKNVYVIKTIASIPTTFCAVIKTTKCPLRVVSTHALQTKMADGRHLQKIEKLLYLGLGSTNFDEIWHYDAIRSSWPFRLLKIWNFKNTIWRKLTYLRCGVSDFDFDLAQWRSSSFLTVPIVKNVKF